MADDKTAKEAEPDKERLTVYLPPDVAQAVRDIAETNKRTISAQVEVMLTDNLPKTGKAPSR